MIIFYVDPDKQMQTQDRAAVTCSIKPKQNFLQLKTKS